MLYQVKGPYRSEATGLSCYYSYNGDVDDLAGYAGIGAGEAFKYFYEYELTGQLTEDGTAYLAGLDIDASALQPVQRHPADAGHRQRHHRRLGQRCVYRQLPGRMGRH